MHKNINKIKKKYADVAIKTAELCLELITNLKNTGLIGTDIKTTVTDLLYNNMPYNKRSGKKKLKTISQRKKG